MTFAERRKLELDYKEWLKRESIINGVAVEDCALSVIGYLDSKGLINKMPDWISVKKKLPEDGQRAFILLQDERTYSADFYCNGNHWWFENDNAWEYHSLVKAWIPIPEYKEGE